MQRQSNGGRGDWARAVEAATLERLDPGERKAAERFDALGSPATKMALVREVVAVRSRELTLAYRSVIMVAAGYKSRTGAAGVNEVHAEPCVIFIVKRKWARVPEGQRAQALPERLLTFGSDGNQRLLYAVPTDVQPAQRYFGGVARSASCVRVDDPEPAFSLPGTLTCGLELKGASAGSRFALSAMHVLSPVPAQAQPAAGPALTAIGGGPSVRGHCSEWGGHIDALRESAFDVQLAQIADSAWFGTAFAGLRLSDSRPYVVAADVFDDLAATMRFQILAPDNHPRHGGPAREPMLAQFLMFNRGEMPLRYQVRFNGVLQTVPLRHRELVMMQVLDDCPAPESGDSGSPVISWWPDGSAVLVGMFIGSGAVPGRERLVYVNPAWQLFDPGNWGRLPAGTTELQPFF